MIIELIIIVLSIIWVVTYLAYVGATIKEKIYLQKNMVVLDNKNISKHDIERMDTKELIINKVSAKSGDEIRVFSQDAQVAKGILVGASKKDGIMLLSRPYTKPIEVKVASIKRIKIISRYGRFMKNF